MQSSDMKLCVEQLKAQHEEADTRMVLHAIHCSKISDCKTVVVSATDTDVLLILLFHMANIEAEI